MNVSEVSSGPSDCYFLGLSPVAVVFMIAPRIWIVSV
uniref:Uncharacterized protein n=1 Tax=Anguilla anguilla TaxID=7936 RepID=A0A0E9PVA7_ANGAN